MAQTELSQFWWYEHLLTLPDAPDEVVNHFGALFTEHPCGSMPPAVSARLFLRYIRTRSMTDYSELLQVLGLLRVLSCKSQHFRSIQAAATLSPPAELLIQLEQLLVESQLTHMAQLQQLQARILQLKSLLSAAPPVPQLQQQLSEAFPASVVQQSLSEYAAAAWAALGASTLQVEQQLQARWLLPVVVTWQAQMLRFHRFHLQAVAQLPKLVVVVVLLLLLLRKRMVVQQPMAGRSTIGQVGSVAADAEGEDKEINQQHKPHKKQRHNVAANADSSDDEFYDAEGTSSQLQQHQQQEGHDVQEVADSRQPANKVHQQSGAQGGRVSQLLVALADLTPDLPVAAPTVPGNQPQSKGKVDDLLEELIAEEWSQGVAIHQQKRKQRQDAAAAAGVSDGGCEEAEVEDGDDEAGQPAGEDGAAQRRQQQHSKRRQLCGAGEAVASGVGRGKTKQWESEPSDVGIDSPEGSPGIVGPKTTPSKAAGAKALVAGKKAVKKRKADGAVAAPTGGDGESQALPGAAAAAADVHVDEDEEGPAAAAGSGGDRQHGQLREQQAARRRPVRWSKEEKELLIELVERYGEGCWQRVLEKGAGGFNKCRTAVDLKDKWRNLKKGKEGRSGSPSARAPTKLKGILSNIFKKSTEHVHNSEQQGQQLAQGLPTVAVAATTRTAAQAYAVHGGAAVLVTAVAPTAISSKCVQDCAEATTAAADASEKGIEISGASHAREWPTSTAAGLRNLPGPVSRGKLCGSVDQMYQDLFGDVPLPSNAGGSSSSSNHFAGSPCLSAAGLGEAGSTSSCCDTPLSHSYSSPDLAGGAGLPPTCARSLFGSVTQVESQPLMATNSWSSRTECCWAPPGQPLAVASDDNFIREINSENVLSAVWGPANAKLAAFKYCAATSPLNHPGRASPFGSPRAHQTGRLSLPEVDFIEKIGRGSFGDVYRGVWCGSMVAVKVIRVRQQQPGPVQQLHAASAAALRPHGSDQNADDQQLASAAHAELLTGLQEQQVSMELAQHEYESWLNANLRHPNIVQLFTSFTVALEDRFGQAVTGVGAGMPQGFAGGGSSGSSSSWGLSWKTHLVMEYCEIGTMQEVLQRGAFMDPAVPGCCNPAWVLSTAKELCVAVAYLHSMDVVHGDLKSSNVLLKAAATTAADTRGFTAKVSDFGLSRVMDAISAANGTTSIDGSSDGTSAAATTPCCGQGWPAGQPRFGALSHAAPELIRGLELSKASDVYSVGVLLWELVTGQLLHLKLTLPTSELLQLPGSAPPALVDLCQQCWNEDPAARPAMVAVVERINGLALQLFGEEQALQMFPDLFRTINAQRARAKGAAALPAAAVM
eukprot:gene5410-5643_t